MRFFLFSLLFSYSAQAIVGKYSDDKNLPQTCKLNFFVIRDGQTLPGICTGSFLGNKTFSSAEHCHENVLKHLNYKIPEEVSEGPWFECPGVDHKYHIKQSIPFRGNGIIELQDIGLMKVEEEIPETELKPMKIPDSAEHIEKLLKDPTKCYVSGYGINNGGSDSYGVLHTTQVIDWEAKPIDYLGSHSQYSFKLFKNYAQHGDSGGPMFCMDGDSPVLIGVTQGRYSDLPFSTVEKFTQSIEWLNYVKATARPDNDVYRQFYKTEDICSATEVCLASLKTASILSSDIQKIVLELEKIKKMRKSVDQMKESLLTGENLEKKQSNKLGRQLMMYGPSTSAIKF